MFGRASESEETMARLRLQAPRPPAESRIADEWRGPELAQPAEVPPELMVLGPPSESEASTARLRLQGPGPHPELTPPAYPEVRPVQFGLAAESSVHSAIAPWAEPSLVSEAEVVGRAPSGRVTLPVALSSRFFL